MGKYNYYYYLGPLDEVDDIDGKCRRVPNGCVGVVDLTPPETPSKNIAFLASTKELSEDHSLLLHGCIVEDLISESIKQKWEELTGYKPQGTYLVELLWDYLTNGSDPEGKDRVKPLMPTSHLLLELHLGGHSLIKKDKFDINTSPHKDKVISVLQKEYSSVKSECDKTKSKKYLQVLDFMGEKYKVENPEDIFIPAGMEKEKAIPHETVITDSFNGADSSTLGVDLTWTVNSGNMRTNDNKAKATNNNESSWARAEHDLSSSDNYAKSVVELWASGGASVIRIGTRQNASNTDRYAVRITKDTTSSHRTEKIISGSTTVLSTTDATGSFPETWKISADGSTIKAFLGSTEKHSSTDTSISSGVRGGIAIYSHLDANDVYIDDFEAGDISAAGAIKKAAGTAWAKVKKIGGVAVANIKKISGVTA